MGHIYLAVRQTKLKDTAWYVAKSRKLFQMRRIEKSLRTTAVEQGAQPLLTWDLLLHFPVSRDLPIWQSCETKQTEPMLVGLSQGWANVLVEGPH